MIHPDLAPSDDDTLSVAVAARLGLAHELLDVDRMHVAGPLADVPSEPVDEADLALERESLKPLAAFAPIALVGEDGDWLLQAPTLLGQLRTQPIAEVIGAWSRYWWRTGRRPWMGLEWRDHLRRWRQGGDPDPTPWLRSAVPRESQPAAQPLARSSAEHPLRPRNVRALSSPQWDMLYSSMAPSVTLAPLLQTLPLVDPRMLAFIFAIPPVPWCQEKHIFRTAMRDELPAAVLNRPKTAHDYYEVRVARWRAQGGADSPISGRVAPWVDVDAVRRTFRGGTTNEVLDAWRVLELDRWLARQEEHGA